VKNSLSSRSLFALSLMIFFIVDIQGGISPSIWALMDYLRHYPIFNKIFRSLTVAVQIFCAYIERLNAIAVVWYMWYIVY
jgi:hypothetical protein